MSGPALVIELAEAPSRAAIPRVRRGRPGSRIGFAPTHAVDIVAFCNSLIDHVVTALPTADVMDLLGGLANVELREDQVPIVAGLPGVVATVTDTWLAAYGSAAFLRAWVQQPGFRLLK